MGQGAQGHRPVVGRHAAKLATGNECRPCAQRGRTRRGDHTGRSSTNHEDVNHGASAARMARLNSSRARGVWRTSRFRLASPSARWGSAPATRPLAMRTSEPGSGTGLGALVPKMAPLLAVATQLGAPGVPSFKNPTTYDSTGIEPIFSRGDPLGCALKRHRTHVGPAAQVSASRPGAGRALARDGGNSVGTFDIFRMKHRKSRLRRIDKPSLSMIGGFHLVE